MRRKGFYILCGFGIAVAEYGALLTEVGNDLERFALAHVAKLNATPWDGRAVPAATQ